MKKGVIDSYLQAGLTRDEAESLWEQSMSAMGGRGWSLRTGYMGSGAVVFPDSDKHAGAFLKSLGRALAPADRKAWMTYASRLGMPETAAERAWGAMEKKELRPKLAETLSTLEQVFETTMWSGHSVPNPMMMKMRHGEPSEKTPKMSKAEKPDSPNPGKFTAPAPSFPFHTKVSRKVYKKALKLIKLYPLENPTQILKRAIVATGTTPLVDLTPEDEKLLRMAIEYAQNGPPASNVRIGGMPGGPFNSAEKKRGAP